MYCDVVNVQPHFNFSDTIIFLNLEFKIFKILTSTHAHMHALMHTHTHTHMHTQPRKTHTLTTTPTHTLSP